MRTHKSGILGLMFATAFLAACEQKSPTVIIEPPVDTLPKLTLQVVPNSLTLPVGATGSLTAVVSGSTNQAVTWSTNNAAVATVNASGVVTAVAVGDAAITAVSQADGRVRNAAAIHVVAAGTGPVASSILIQSVTQGGTTLPVAINNVQGQIDITAGVEIPAGSGAQSIEFYVDNRRVCVQNFSNGTGETADASASVPVVCSVNTAAYDSTAAGLAPHFLNGVHTVSARIVGANGNPSAHTAEQQYVFNNQNFINATINYGRGCAFGTVEGFAPAGTVWCGGDVTVSARPVIYVRQAATGDTAFASQALRSVTVSMRTAGKGANGTAADECNPTAKADVCGTRTATLTDNTISNGAFEVVFPAASLISSNGSGRIEDQVQFRITSNTVGGQVGPICINPDFVVNTHNLGSAGSNDCGTGEGELTAPGTKSAPNQVYRRTADYLDNLAPRVANFRLPGHNQGDAGRARYLNAAFNFAGVGTGEPTMGTGVVQSMVDLGVDQQTAQFNVTLPGGATHVVATGADVATHSPETETNDVLTVSATVRDALGNAATYYPTTAGTATTTTSLATKVGLDLTNPTITSPNVDCVSPTTTGGNCVFNTPGAPGAAWTFTFRDTAVAPAGPSGFFNNPIRAFTLRTRATRVDTVGVAYGQVMGTMLTVTRDSSTEGYYRTRAFVRDAAGNASSEINRVVLLDRTAPTIAGITAASTIRGWENTSFSADMADNVELGDLGVFIGYGSAYSLLHEPQGNLNAQKRLQISTYGDDALVSRYTAPVTISRFIRSVEETNADGRADGTINRATSVTYLLRDVAGYTLGDSCTGMMLNCAERTLDITANVNAGSTSFPAFAALTFPSANTWNDSTGSQFRTRTSTSPYANGSTAQSVCNRSGCTTASSVTLTATVTGPQASFAQPFTEVRFYYVSGTRSILIGTGSVVGSIDDDVLDQRRWVYQITWTPTGVPTGTYAWYALGIHSSGSALATQNGAGVTVTTN